ncbi:hypothetical protein [Luteibacter sp. RCC_6_2]|uniref:hypothetical protein n=1 Tax=Luteibacter sp. RCC_6_2 TaxID=3239223 RepID=UPI003525A85D
MELKKTVLEMESLGDSTHAFEILPRNFERPDEEPLFHAASISFAKYAKDKIDLAPLPASDRFLVQKSADIYLPILKFAIDNWAVGAPFLNMVIDVVVAYMKDTHPNSKDAQVKFSVVVEETATHKVTRLDYSGPVEGLKDLKMDAFKDV